MKTLLEYLNDKLDIELPWRYDDKIRKQFANINACETAELARCLLSEDIINDEIYYYFLKEFNDRFEKLNLNSFGFKKMSIAIMLETYVENLNEIKDPIKNKKMKEVSKLALNIESALKQLYFFNNPFTPQKVNELIKKLKNGEETFYDELMDNNLDQEAIQQVGLWNDFKSSINKICNSIVKENKYLIPLLQKISKINNAILYEKTASKIQQYIEETGVCPGRVEEITDHYLDLINGDDRWRGSEDYYYPTYLDVLKEIMSIIDEDWEWSDY